MSSAYLESQGQLLRMKVRRDDRSANGGGGKRGKVTGFSKKSRHRLLIFFSRMETKGARATFLTLTFQVNPDAREAKNALKRFLMRIRRHYGQVSGVWRMEFSEKGRLHFHLLLFNLPFIPQKRVQLVWTACTREDLSIVDIRLAKGSKRVMSYVAKYISKPTPGENFTSLEDETYQHAPRDDCSGRVWGYINKNALPFGERCEGVLLGTEAIERVRNITMFLSRGRSGKSVFQTHLFSRDAAALWRALISVHGLEMDDYKNSSFCPSWEEMNVELHIRHFTAFHQ